jgi:hypothetical protein
MQILMDGILGQFLGKITEDLCSYVRGASEELLASEEDPLSQELSCWNFCRSPSKLMVGLLS